MSKQIIVRDISKDPFGSFMQNKVKFQYISENESRREFYDNEKHIVNHWSAGRRNQLWDGYHFNITEINDQIFVFKTLKRKEKGQHLWGRNTGCIGNSICSMFEGDKPTDGMIDTLALLNAEQCAWYGLNPEGTILLPKKKVIEGKLVTIAGNINAPIIADHKHFSDIEYPSQRIDIGVYMITVKRKAIQYLKELKDGKRQFLFKEIIK